MDGTIWHYIQCAPQCNSELLDISGATADESSFSGASEVPQRVIAIDQALQLLDLSQPGSAIQSVLLFERGPCRCRSQTEPDCRAVGMCNQRRLVVPRRDAGNEDIFMSLTIHKTFMVVFMVFVVFITNLT